jgi:hypothetical protein
MAKDHGPSIKDDKLYEELRDDGASKEKGGEAENYEDRTKEALEERGREIGIEGRTEMSKDELIDALRNH